MLNLTAADSDQLLPSLVADQRARAQDSTSMEFRFRYKAMPAHDFPQGAQTASMLEDPSPSQHQKHAVDIVEQMRQEAEIDHNNGHCHPFI